MWSTVRFAVGHWPLSGEESSSVSYFKMQHLFQLLHGGRDSRLVTLSNREGKGEVLVFSIFSLLFYVLCQYWDQGKRIDFWVLFEVFGKRLKSKLIFYGSWAHSLQRGQYFRVPVFPYGPVPVWSGLKISRVLTLLPFSPHLILQNFQIKNNDLINFLGLISHCTSVSIHHIKNLETKCLGSINVLKCLSHPSEGCNRKLLPHLYLNFIGLRSPNLQPR